MSPVKHICKRVRGEGYIIYRSDDMFKFCFHLKGLQFDPTLVQGYANEWSELAWYSLNQSTGPPRPNKSDSSVFCA
jgi:hypothetical protein